MEFPELLGLWGCGGGDQIHIFIPFTWSQVGNLLGEVFGESFREMFGEVFREVFTGTWRALQCEMTLGSLEKALIPHHSLHRIPNSRETGRAQGAGQGLSQSCSWSWNLSTVLWRLLSRTSCRDTARAKRSWQTFPAGSGTCRQPCSPQDLGITASPTQGHAPGSPCLHHLQLQGAALQGQTGSWDGAGGGCSWQKALEFLLIPSWMLPMVPEGGKR